MAYEFILKNISKHISLTDDEKEYFISLLKPRAIARKDFVLKEAQPCRYLSFVDSGILRAYYMDKTGKEATIMFAMADWWITDMHCFINQQPAMLNIQAVEDSHIFHLQKDDLDQLYMKVPAFERFFRIIMQNAYVREQLRVIQSLSWTAEERYDHFISKYPQVAAQVTQKQIASYLGITPEFLSLLRSNKSRKNIS